MPYLLDADVFIQAKNLHYGLDFCPGFWSWLIEQNASGQVFSIEKVGDEIAAGADELAIWAAQRGSTCFIPPETSARRASVRGRATPHRVITLRWPTEVVEQPSDELGREKCRSGFGICSMSRARGLWAGLR